MKKKWVLCAFIWYALKKKSRWQISWKWGVRRLWGVLSFVNAEHTWLWSHKSQKVTCFSRSNNVDTTDTLESRNWAGRRCGPHQVRVVDCFELLFHTFSGNILQNSDSLNRGMMTSDSNDCRFQPRKSTAKNLSLQLCTLEIALKFYN